MRSITTLQRAESQNLIAENERVHQRLVDGVPVANRSDDGSVAKAALYDAIATNEASVLELGDETRKRIATDLGWTVQESATIDWNLKESVRAAVRAKIRRQV